LKAKGFDKKRNFFLKESLILISVNFHKLMMRIRQKNAEFEKKTKL